MFYIWAGREFGWSVKEVDDMYVSDLMDIYVLNDKLSHPEDYRPAEYYFKP